MNIYLYKGYDVIGRKWVYGDLVHNQKVTKTGLVPRTMVGGYEVAPDSVGMYTGLTDKLGNKIFEGDILRLSYNGKALFDATVKWYERYAGFFIDESDGCISPIPKNLATVIGNKYEEVKE